MLQNKQYRNLSKLRQSLFRLADQNRKLIPVFLERSQMVKGTVYLLKRRCGKSNCRCARGQLHTTTVLTASISGRTRLKTIPAEQIEKLKLLTKQYRRFRIARANFVKRYTQILKIIDKIEHIRRVEDYNE